MTESILLRKEAPMYLAIALVITLLAWSAGLGFFPLKASAQALTSVSDTISDSHPGNAATHTIAFTNASSMEAQEWLKVTIDAINAPSSTFGLISTVTSTDISFSGGTFVTTCTGAASEIQWWSASSSNIWLRVCAADTIAAGSKTLTIANKITNSTTTGSYVVRIEHYNTAQTTVLNNADTRIAIISNVLLSASVDTSFTFTISGTNAGTTLNGSTVTSTRTSTATALNFGTLPLTNPVTMIQQLTVATNARNGFVVTVKENQNPLSQTGADIDLFANAVIASTPQAWSAPSSTLGSEWTYGHIGLSSDDADLNSNEFSTGTLFAGNFQATSSRQVFSATGTSDGTTQNIGLAKVAWRIQIGALQEAATDYTNTLTYVATPTF